MSMNVVVIKIPAGTISVPAIRKALKVELRAEGKDDQIELRKTTSSWKSAKPAFTSKVTEGRDFMQVHTRPSRSPMGIKKWNWLDKGTAVRHAVMSPNWRSKTKPGRRQSAPGAGKVMRVSRNIKRDGIKARKWSEDLTKERARPFAKRIKKALAVAVFGGKKHMRFL